MPCLAIKALGVGTGAFCVLAASAASSKVDIP
jgi:hypothetical protein